MQTDDDPPAHRIRLRGPWEFERIAVPPELPAERRSGRVTLPSTWRDGLGSAGGTVRICRRFGSPPDPDLFDRVWLEIDCVDTRVDAALNGDPIGFSDGEKLCIDVTTRLAARNRLELALTRDAAALSDAPLPKVALRFEARDEIDPRKSP